MGRIAREVRPIASSEPCGTENVVDWTTDETLAGRDSVGKPLVSVETLCMVEVIVHVLDFGICGTDWRELEVSQLVTATLL